MPRVPPSAHGGTYQPESSDGADYWRRRAQAAEHELAEAARAEERQGDERDDLLAAVDALVTKRIEAAFLARGLPTPVAAPSSPAASPPMRAPAFSSPEVEAFATKMRTERHVRIGKVWAAPICGVLAVAITAASQCGRTAPPALPPAPERATPAQH